MACKLIIKKLLLTMIAVCFSTALFAQYEVTIEASVLDRTASQPIQYVNIEFKGSHVKTITDGKGEFKLVYDEESIGDETLFKCTAFGYTPILVNASKLFKLLKNTNKIYMVRRGDAVIKPSQKKQNYATSGDQLITTKKRGKQEANIKMAKGNIFGIVTSDSKPIQAATIRIKNTYTEVQTDINGNYHINANQNDVLVVSYLGMLNKEVRVLKGKAVNIELEPDGELLEEVLLEGEAKNEEFIDLGGTSTNKKFDAITTKINVLTAKDIGSQYNDVETLLNGRFAGLNLPQPGITSNVSRLAGYGFVVDGMAFDSPPYIDPQNIETLIYSKGTILITTKAFAVPKFEKPIKSLLAVGNDYVEAFSDVNILNISGLVTSGKKPIQGATITIKNTFASTQSNVDGKFTIKAKEGDVLVINYLGMLQKEMTISNATDLNVDLEPDGELLEEVLLEVEAKKEDLIDLGLSGKKSFDAIGTSVNVMTAKDIGPQYTSLGELLQGKFAALNHTRQGSPNYNLGLTYDLDGMIFPPTPGFKMPYVDPQNIESLTILTSLASTVKYGTLGRGGVIVIKTKTIGNDKAKPPLKSLLTSGNDYEETVSPTNNVKQKVPFYILELQKALSYSQALAIYKTQQQNKTQLGIPYYIDVSNYFMRWDKKYAYAILSRIADIAHDNPKALNTLAYNLEVHGRLEDAKQVYQRIAVLRPNDAQSYRDLALIYAQTGYYSEAISLYSKILNGSFDGIDFKGLKNVITSELKHLLAKHRTKIDYSNVHADYLQADFKYDVRIVFDWNDANTEFEVQFVNPKKKFFTWSHTKLNNRERMIDGITKGYHTEEYIIDDDAIGEWIINIESINEEPQLNPTYLKYTVYRNYGLANETKEIKVINLNNCKPKITFDKLLNALN